MLISDVPPSAVVSVLLLCTGCTLTNAPLSHAGSRPTLLSFGLYVTPDPEQNPIDPPERFTGFHTGVDFEIFEDEAETEVPVYAICNGNVIFSDYADGYGGVVVHTCNLDGEEVTVLYGHLLLSSLIEKGLDVKSGDRLGILAPARSYDSGENRKHLHLGIHRGSELQLRGYVEKEKELEQFIDPVSFISSSMIPIAMESSREIEH